MYQSEDCLELLCQMDEIDPNIYVELQESYFDEKPKDNYFNYVQPWTPSTNNPANGINFYTFALQPEQHQPTGTANFTRVDNTKLSPKYKYTALLYAVKYGYVKCVEILCKTDKINLNPWKFTLMVAAKYNNIECTKMLMDKSIRLL